MSIYVRDADGNRQKIAGVGLPGPAGKSAYQYAVEGGFTGTEEEFRAVVGVRSNPNLLDNWYFADPINQKGQLEYTGNVYTIDRWQGGQNEIIVRVEDGYISCTGTGVNFQQFIRSNLAGQIICMSALCAGNARLILGYIQNGAYQYPATADINQESIGLLTLTYYIPVDAIQPAIFLQTSFGTARYYAAKLELGPVQTLAHKDASGNWVLNDPPPNKALELAKCQQYQVFGPLYGVKVWEHVGGWCGFYIPTPVILKRAPTLIGKIQYRVGGNVEDIDYANNIPGFNLLQNGCYTYMHVPDNTNMIIIPQGSGLDSNL